jgi:hypothetical protein
LGGCQKAVSLLLELDKLTIQSRPSGERIQH